MRMQGFGEERVVGRLSMSCRKRNEGEGYRRGERGWYGERRCRVRGWIKFIHHQLSLPFQKPCKGGVHGV